MRPTNRRATLSIISFSYIALALMLTFIVAPPMAAKATGQAGALPWIIGIGCDLAGLAFATLRLGTSPPNRYQSDYLVCLAIIELGLLLGIFMFVGQGYPMWAPATIAIPALVLVWVKGVLLRP